MACQSLTLLTGMDCRCQASVGGIKRILLADRDAVTVTVDDATKEISAITLAKGKKFAEWRFRKNTGNYTSTATIDPTIGNSAVTTEVNLQFSRAENTKRLEIQTALNGAAVVIVEDMYGQHIYLGLDNEVTITSAVMQSGTATSDLSGFTLTFQDVAEELPHFISEDVKVDELLVAPTA